MRLFAAIEISSEIRAALAAFVKELRGTAPQVKWVRTENLHVTLKFLGETEPGKIAAIGNALREVRSADPVTLEFRGLGFFPQQKRPRVFWVGMEASANLGPVARDIDQRLHGLGFPLEERPFTPHLTLARFDPTAMPPKLGAAVAAHASRTFGSLTACDFHLVESKLKPTGAEYTTLQSFQFLVAEN